MIQIKVVLSQHSPIVARSFFSTKLLFTYQLAYRLRNGCSSIYSDVCSNHDNILVCSLLASERSLFIHIDWVSL